MNEFFVDTKHGEFGLEEWSELIGRFPNHADRAIASALKSEGSRLRKIIQMCIRQGGPPGAPWLPLHPRTLTVKAHRRREARWAAKEAKGVKVRAATKRKYRGVPSEMAWGAAKPFQKAIGATQYYYDDDIKTVSIGFLKDTKIRYLMSKHAEGFTYKVDSRMRKFLALHGFPVKESTTLKVPARPVVGPVFEKEKATILKNVKEKSMRSIYRYLTGKSKEQVDQEWRI